LVGVVLGITLDADVVLGGRDVTLGVVVGDHGLRSVVVETASSGFHAPPSARLRPVARYPLAVGRSAGTTRGVGSIVLTVLVAGGSEVTEGVLVVVELVVAGRLTAEVSEVEGAVPSNADWRNPFTRS
jgi:hypothetical protein